MFSDNGPYGTSRGVAVSKLALCCGKSSSKISNVFTMSATLFDFVIVYNHC